MSKKNVTPPAPQRMKKGGRGGVHAPRHTANGERWDSEDFRRCRPKRDWGNGEPAGDGEKYQGSISSLRAAAW